MAEMQKKPKGGGKSAKQKEGSKGKPSGAGRRSGKFEGMFARKTERRLRHTCKRNGPGAARAYADEKGIMASLRKLATENTRAGRAAAAAIPLR